MLSHKFSEVNKLFWTIIQAVQIFLLLPPHRVVETIPLYISIFHLLLPSVLFVQITNIYKKKSIKIFRKLANYLIKKLIFNNSYHIQNTYFFQRVTITISSTFNLMRDSSVQSG